MCATSTRICHVDSAVTSTGAMLPSWGRSRGTCRPRSKRRELRAARMRLFAYAGSFRFCRVGSCAVAPFLRRHREKPGQSTADNGEHAFLLGRSKQEPIPYLWIGTLRPSYWAAGSRVGVNQMHVVSSSRRVDAAADEFHPRRARGRPQRQRQARPRRGADNYYGAFVLDPDGNNIEACSLEGSRRRVKLAYGAVRQPASRGLI